MATIISFLCSNGDDDGEASLARIDCIVAVSLTTSKTL